ncbi:hypothetical protein GCHA_4341 [Paraglaciecola chathamensis S18K6]|uniref:Uncharacterized protein n=1 Tax=Paraglaciecola chathamensis S18K6 TaxID=1127672 RepID=A0AAV3V675_9ALTE|nr:hypothetical protein GCHA_4341 [Paraglaciecola chathamensis S18K6]
MGKTAKIAKRLLPIMTPVVSLKHKKRFCAFMLPYPLEILRNTFT